MLPPLVSSHNYQTSSNRDSGTSPRRKVSEWQRTLGHLNSLQEPPGSAGAQWEHYTYAKVGPHTTVLHSASAMGVRITPDSCSFFLVFLGMKIIPVKRPCSSLVGFQTLRGFVPRVCAAGPSPGAELEATLTSTALRATPMLVNHSCKQLRGVFQYIFATTLF